jgi:hypothetical protein
MRHYFTVYHDTESALWEFDYEANQAAFGLDSILDTESGDWLRSIVGTESAPNEEELHDELARMFEQLNAKNTAPAVRAPLEHIAQLLTQTGEDRTDGECLDDVWQYLETLGINPAAAQITDVTNAAASPAFTASASPALGSAVNPCTGGEPIGWAVYCGNPDGDWIETGFSDEEAAERFATAWRNYSDANTARPCLLIVDSRNEWHGEPITAYLGCGNECGHEQEFSGWLDDTDLAHFPCPNCGAIFTHDNWSEFFDEDEETE